jgi:hypothetical protein
VSGLMFSPRRATLRRNSPWRRYWVAKRLLCGYLPPWRHGTWRSALGRQPTFSHDGSSPIAETSAVGQKETLQLPKLMTGLHPTADIERKATRGEREWHTGAAVAQAGRADHLRRCAPSRSGKSHRAAQLNLLSIIFVQVARRIRRRIGCGDGPVPGWPRHRSHSVHRPRRRVLRSGNRTRILAVIFLH